MAHLSTTTHDISVDGINFIMVLTLDSEQQGTVQLTEACNDAPCEWFTNKASEPAWCCSTHMYDGTGDYPVGAPHPAVCEFSDVDEEGECQTEHQTYDFNEVQY